MSSNLSDSFPVAKDAYIAFDGLSIQEKIRQRLSQTGIFTDQNFVGSNLAALNDVFSMIFSLLIYNLNKSSNEGLFTETSLYENINRIVKQLDHKPIGHQTATLIYNLSASNINAGIYTIPRYTNISVGGIKYSFNTDFTFSKTTNNTLEEIVNSDNNILYQGQFVEYPTINPSGNSNEIVYLTVNDTNIVDNINIHVYVKSLNGKWEKWKKTESLYLNTGNDKVYELRFNENKRYELKWGDDINGKKLNSSDQVAIYYLLSDGSNGEVGANTLDGKRASGFNSVRFTNILNDQDVIPSYMSNTQLQQLKFSNSCVSTYYNLPETVDQIRANAPSSFRSQHRLVTASDYTNFVRSNFSNFIHDVKCMNNTSYLDSYMKYFYDLQLTKPQLESRALFNQTNFADACNFNNVYLFMVPRTIKTTLSYLSPAQKSLILESIGEEQTLTAEIIPMDAVYIALDIALSVSNTTSVNDVLSTKIQITKTATNRRSDDAIRQDVANVITNYFSRENLTLGQSINLVSLTEKVLAVSGVKSVSTYRTDTGASVAGLQFLSWNPIYPDVSSVLITGNYTLENFQFPYLFNDNFVDRIILI